MVNFIKFLIKKVLYYKWLTYLDLSRNTSLNSGYKATAILLSYKRAQNIEPITRSLLKCTFIEKIIVSNHNPEIKIEDWIKIDDKRIVLINQPIKRRPGYRWVLAKEEKNADYFIALDDDAFVYPKQITKLFEQLLLEPEVLHGAKGSIYPNPKRKKVITGFFQERNMEVEVLHQVYFVTRKHVETYFKFIDSIKLNNSTLDNYIDPFSAEDIGDDIIISHTGKGKAKIHDVGHLLTCPTQYTKGIAVCSSENFDATRAKIINEVQKIAIMEDETDKYREGVFQENDISTTTY